MSSIILNISAIFSDYILRLKKELTSLNARFNSNRAGEHSSLVFPGGGRIAWVGVEIIPEFSRAASKNENFPIVRDTIGKKGEEKSPPELGDSSPLPFWPAAGRTIPMNPGSDWRRLRRGEPPRQSMPSNSRAVASQARKSASGSSVVERRGGGGRSGGSQSLRCRRIFSMTHRVVDEAEDSKRPPHLGQVNGICKIHFANEARPGASAEAAEVVVLDGIGT